MNRSKSIGSIFFLFGIMAFSSCSPTLKFSWTMPQYEAERFNRVAVFALLPNWEIRSNVEDAFILNLQQNGYRAVAGMDIIPPSRAKPGQELDLEQIRSQLVKQGIDAVIAVAVVESEKHVHYEPGGMYVVPTGVARFGYYYSYTYRYVYQPGYYSQSTSYVVEYHLYDIRRAKEDGLVWAAQTNVADSGSPQSVSSKQAKIVVRSMVRDGVL